MEPQPITLRGRHVRLEPLSMDHHAALCDVALDESLWQWTTTALRTRDDVAAYVRSALEERAAGLAVPFATVDESSGRVVGSTRFGNMSRADRRVEIGWTFVAPPWQRTPVNTEAKYLMLAHAFETWDCLRVEFKTDALNERSRRAILRLGATEEGTLRSHMVTHTGRVRDTVYYSMVKSEWPDVKSRLSAMLAR
jgi:RimJ/RimL family protein N-acetyltransferase